MKTQNKRFVALKGHKGIRQDTKTGNYQARKYIDGKEYSESFSKISQALKWKNEFHPSLKEKEEILNESTHRFNGVETEYKFEDIWNLYREQHLPSISPQSRSDVLKRANKIAPKLVKYRMVHINAKVLDSVVKELVNEASKEDHNKRHSFDKELQTLRAILNWYKENYDAMFVLPILKRHYIAGTIKKKIKSTKKMTISEVKKFFEAIEDEFWRDFAEIHFFMAGRVQEPAGLQVKSVDFKNRILSVCDVSVWGEIRSLCILKRFLKMVKKDLFILMIE